MSGHLKARIRELPHNDPRLRPLCILGMELLLNVHAECPLPEDAITHVIKVYDLLRNEHTTREQLLSAASASKQKIIAQHIENFWARVALLVG